MIIQYDTRPNATVDEKLRSLIHSIQLALGEIEATAGGEGYGGTGDISAILSTLQQLSTSLASALIAISGIDERVTDLEESVSPTTYDNLEGKPSIEGVTLVGDKTFPNLNLDVLTNTEVEAIFDNLI